MGQAATMDVKDLATGAAGGGIFVALGSLLLYIGKKLIGDAPQADLNAGYAKLLADTRSMLAETRTELTAACTQRDEFRELLEAERRITTALTGEVRQLHQIAQSLTNLMRNAGLNIPPAHVPAPPPLIVGATLRQDGDEPD